MNRIVQLFSGDKMKTLLSLSGMAAMLFAPPAFAQDKSGSRDPDGLARYQGADIRGYRQPSPDEILMPTGVISDDADPKTASHLEGEVEHVDYVIRPAVAPLAVDRHYAALLTREGYTTVFACAGEKACGAQMASLILNSGKVAPTGLADGIFSDKIRVIVARKGNDWVLMHVNTGPDAAHVYLASVTDATARPQ